MALQIHLTADQNQVGADFPEAYARIAAFLGDKLKITFDVLFYANKDAAKGGADHAVREIEAGRFEVAMPATFPETLLAYLYEQLKLNPFFESAIDA